MTPRSSVLKAFILFRKILLHGLLGVLFAQTLPGARYDVPGRLLFVTGFFYNIDFFFI